MACDAKEADDAFIFGFLQSFHTSIVGKDVVYILISFSFNIMDLPQVDGVDLHVFQGTFQVPHGPVVAPVMGLCGQEYFIPPGGQYLSKMPFTGSTQVITLTTASIHAIPGRGVDIVDAHINAFVDNGNGLLLHTHLLHRGLGPQAVYAHTLPGGTEGTLRYS